MDKIFENYLLWKEKVSKDEDVIRELNSINGNKAEIEDRFYKDLEFGTGGLRGIIGAGTNRMNIYTVAKASQGLANYINNFFDGKKYIAISYDNRIKSDLFAKVSAGVFAANKIEVYIYPELMPTPCLSYAVRKLHCNAGIMITASHNPAKYNGYKVYGNDGCQITNKAAKDIFNEIEKLNIFDDIRKIDFDTGLKNKYIKYIDDEVYTSFIEDVKKQSLLGNLKIDKDISIVYTPLHGTGLKPVTRALKEMGYTNITIVKEQANPDGNFKTCEYPNPEVRESMIMGLEYAKKHNAELVIATDPDCDRVGISVKNRKGEFVLLTGNEVGLLLLDYICSRRIKLNNMPENPVIIKTIVTTDMAGKIASHYGVKVINVLTGFKFIGEQIGLLEEKNRKDDFIFGFEESYGYLSGSYVRDKDAVNGATLIIEMFAYYKSLGISLVDKLNELYEKYGFTINSLHTFEFNGKIGVQKMQNIMEAFRCNIKSFGNFKINKVIDYNKGIDGLPKSNVLKFILDNGSVVVRPSGTEPKLKFYIQINNESQEEAKRQEMSIIQILNTYM